MQEDGAASVELLKATLPGVRARFWKILGRDQSPGWGTDKLVRGAAPVGSLILERQEPTVTSWGADSTAVRGATADGEPKSQVEVWGWSFMKRALYGALILVLVGSLTTLILIRNDNTHTSQTPASDARAKGVGGAGGAENASYPRRLTPGIYESRIWGRNAPADAVERGQAAATAEDGSPKFRGWVGPIYVQPDSPHRTPAETLPPGADGDIGCRPDELVPLSQTDVEQSAYAIATPAYLPPGTFEEMPPSGTSCNGTPVMVTRQLHLNDPSMAYIGIVRLIGVNVLDFSASAQRVSAGTVDGKEAVLISPLTPEGFGGSAVVIKETYGFTKVGGDEVPFDVLLQIAEAM